eukprot:4934076-Pyramimonas_sp.AAC.1
MRNSSPKSFPACMTYLASSLSQSTSWSAKGFWSSHLGLSRPLSMAANLLPTPGSYLSLIARQATKPSCLPACERNHRQRLALGL